MRAPHLPQTPEEMTSLLFGLITQKVYQQITTAARRRRLTEHDIALIERQGIDELRGDLGFANEFKTFEAEPAIAKARQLLDGYFAATRATRQNEIGKSG